MATDTVHVGGRSGSAFPTACGRSSGTSVLAPASLADVTCKTCLRVLESDTARAGQVRAAARDVVKRREKVLRDLEGL